MSFGNEWVIRDQAPYRLHDEVRKATIFALANGYMSSRGAPEDAPLNEPGIVGHHINGLYDTPDGDILKREIINLPAWTPITLHINGQAPDFQSYTRSLDMRRGLLLQEAEGSRLRLHSERMVSMARPHIAAIQWRLEADADCNISLISAIDARITNRFAETHFRQVDVLADGIIEVTTIEQRHHVAVVAAHLLEGVSAEGRCEVQDQRWSEKWTFQLRKGQTFILTKFAAVYDSLFSAGDPSKLCRAELAEAQQAGYEALLAEHVQRWDELWSVSDVGIEGDNEAQRALRFCLFHLLANLPQSERVSISARGLQGQDYWGSIFWDYEIYVLPFFIYTQPAYARRSLIYRYHTLNGARRKAQSLGYRGAYYAWQSQETGDETCALYVFDDPRSGQKIRSYFADEQIHISADIVYAIRQYVQATGDWAFMADYGLEIVCEVARFFASRVSKIEGQYEIRTVLGPDEYHERVDNNAYTNALARLSLEVALEALERTDSVEWVRERIGLTDEEIESWREIYQMLYVPAPQPELIEQFGGYFALEDAPPDVVRQRLPHPDMHPGGPLGPYQSTQAIKQADVVILLYLLRDIYSEHIKKVNWEYYEPRTAHDSSLSPMAYALVAADVGMREWAYRYFMQTAMIDLLGTGPHWNLGVHTAAMGGAWQAVVFGFCKLDLRADGVHLRGWPTMPEHWQTVRFKFYWHDHLIHFTVGQQKITLKAESGPVPLVYPGGQVTLNSHQPIDLKF